MKEREAEWKDLRRQAAAEQDPKKLLELTKRTNDLLEGKQRRLDGTTKETPPKP